MSLILRNVKYLRRLSIVGWRAALGPPQIEVTGVKLEFYKPHPFKWNIVQSYATRHWDQSKPSDQDYEMAKQRIEESIRKYGYVSKIDIEKMLSYLQTTGSPSNLEVLFLIRCCGKYLFEGSYRDCINLVEKIWKLGQAVAVPLDVSHYNALLNTFIEKNHDFSPDEFLQSMQNKKIEPNRVTYQRLIQHYCQKGDINGAMKILEIMKEKGLPLCETVFKSLIIGHSEVNDMESALEVLKIMENANILPSVDTYLTILCAYAKQGDLESIESTMQDFTKKNIDICEKELLEVYYSLVANGHLSKAEEFMNLHIRKIVPDIDVNRITAKLVNTGFLLPAMNLIERTSTSIARKKSREIFALRIAIINSDIPFENIIDVTKKIANENNDPQIFPTIAHICMINEIPLTNILKLFEAWHENGGEIREHYFWPMIRLQTKNNNRDNIAKIIKAMMKKFDITPSTNMLQEYIIPFMFTTWKEAIDGLQSFGIPMENACIAIAQRLLFEYKLRNFIAFVATYPMKYPKEQLLKCIVETYIVREEAELFINAIRLLEKTPEKEDRNVTPIELIDESIKILLDMIPQYKFRTVISLIKKMEELGLSISPEVAKQIEVFLAENITPDIKLTLENLSSGTLSEIPLTQCNFMQNGSVATTITRQDIMPLKREFSKNLMMQDSESILRSLEVMEQANVQSPAMYAQAINVLCELGNLEAVEKCISKISTDSYLKLDHYKIIKYVTLLVKNGRIDDALHVLNNQPSIESSEMLANTLIQYTHKLLTTLAELKDNENLKKIFNVLKMKNFVQINNFTLGPLVKVHMLNGDIEKAIEVFEEACVTYKCSPYKNLLVKELIRKEDADSLQKITDLCSSLYGENNALVDLAFIFIECKRFQQARKILENSNSRIHNERIRTLIKRLITFSDYESLEKLPQIFKNTRTDLNELFDDLLSIAVSRNDWMRGLSLWTEMQESDVQPTPEFLSELTALLEKNGQSVPFMHTPTQQGKPVENSTRNEEVPSIKSHRSEEDMPQHINQMTSQEISFFSYNESLHAIKKYQAILSLLEENQIDEALKRTMELLNVKAFNNRSVFIELTKKLIAAGRIEDFKKLGNMMDKSLQTKLIFKKMLAFAHIKLYGLKNYFEAFKRDEDSQLYNHNHNHYGATVFGLLDDPSCLPMAKEWAKNLEIRGIHRGQDVLWNYYFIKNLPEANVLYADFTRNNRIPLIRPIIEYSITYNDTEVMKRFHALVKECPVLISNAKVRTLSGLIEIFTRIECYNDALEVLLLIEHRYSSKGVPKRVILELRDCLKRNNENIPESLDKYAIELESQDKVSAAEV